jgi:hypothetical protein
MKYIIATNTYKRSGELVEKSLRASLNQKISPVKVILKTLPPFPRDIVSRREGVLEVIISELGEVESAIMRTPINPRYDQIVLTAARTWKYEPATLNGKPVRFRKVIAIAMKPAF